jgi:hypothetical protein
MLNKFITAPSRRPVIRGTENGTRLRGKSPYSERKGRAHGPQRQICDLARSRVVKFTTDIRNVGGGRL